MRFRLGPLHPKSHLHLSVHKCAVLVLAAAEDSIFRPEGYRDVFQPLARATVEIIPGIDHFQLVTSDDLALRVGEWQQELFMRCP
jgi:pimeloyl-ACP methyl ester carboxylesterase